VSLFEFKETGPVAYIFLGRPILYLSQIFGFVCTIFIRFT